MCSKCTAGVANLPAIIAAVIYFAFAAMHSATESDWAMDQSRAFDAACNSTAVPLPNNESRPAGLLHGDVACVLDALRGGLDSELLPRNPLLALCEAIKTNSTLTALGCVPVPTLA